MSDQKKPRLSKVAQELNVSIHKIAEVLKKKGFEVKPSPNTEITNEQYAILEKEFSASKAIKKEASNLHIGGNHGTFVIDTSSTKRPSSDEDEDYPFLENLQQKENQTSTPTKEESKPEKEGDSSNTKPGLKIVGKVDLDALNKRGNTSNNSGDKKKDSYPPKKQEHHHNKGNQHHGDNKPHHNKGEHKPYSGERKDNPQKSHQNNPSQQHHQNKDGVNQKPRFEGNRPNQDPQKKNGDNNNRPPFNKDNQHNQERKPSGQNFNQQGGGGQRNQQGGGSGHHGGGHYNRPHQENKGGYKKPEFTPKQPFNKPVLPKIDEPEEFETIKAKADSLQGLRVVGKIELPLEVGKVALGGGGKKKAKKVATTSDDKKKRKRFKGEGSDKVVIDDGGDKKKAKTKKSAGKQVVVKKRKDEVSVEEVNKGFQATLSKLGDRGINKGSRSKYRKDKRNAVAAEEELRMQQEEADSRILKITEFISTSELATLMGIGINELIAKCMSMKMYISINQRLDADTIELLAAEYDFEVQFISAEEEAENIADDDGDDDPSELEARAPIVTIMGHVDHGKTSLLDYIRKSKVAEGEAGGITQHIGAYDVTTNSGRRIVFLDTPGHEAFTAMRARGARLTDVAIIVVAADDNVMPQTIEAINHAQVAGVPIVFAINKVDKPTANPQRIREELAKMNILVASWGGKYQDHEISAKSGKGIDDLLEGVLLEADVLDLKANPNKAASGTIVEASLDKGKGYVATVLVQSGTLKIGDIILAGQHHGRVKAMIDHRGNKFKEVLPSTPVQLLGLNGAPQAGDKLTVMASEREVREIAAKREQISREQSIKATRRIGLEDIGKRIAIGNFQQLNIVLKGDVDGSVEALAGSLLKLTTDEVAINIVYRAVGPISESDVLLASASDAIVIGFQVRPTAAAKKIAERESVEIRLYSIIYDAINEVKKAMEGMLAPEFEETIVGNVEIREVFKISKVGNIAGCFVTDGYIKRNSKVRVIREGIVVFGGNEGGAEIAALKRFKDDVSEVKQGFECGMNLKGFNDIQVGDIIEVFEVKEVKRTLSK
jgi:translation initiation factor IF-2